MTDRNRWDETPRDRGWDDDRNRQDYYQSRQAEQFQDQSQGRQQGGWSHEDYGDPERQRARNFRYSRDDQHDYGRGSEFQTSAGRYEEGRGYRNSFEGSGATYPGGYALSTGSGQSRGSYGSVDRNPYAGREFGPDYSGEFESRGFGQPEDARHSRYGRQASYLREAQRPSSQPSFWNDYNGERDHNRHAESGHDRGFFERAGDEVASWFGDKEAARRREQDYRGHGPSDYTRSDDRIREDANDRLTEDARVNARNISVSVQNGEITLNGTVGSRDQKRRAEDVVEDISGVKHVQNNLRVQDSASQSTSYGGSAATSGDTGGAGGTWGSAGSSGSGLGTSNVSSASGTGTTTTGTTSTSSDAGLSSGSTGTKTTSETKA